MCDVFVMRLLKDYFIFAVEKARQGDPCKSDAGIANSIISLVMTNFGIKVFLLLSYFFNKRKKTVCMFS